MRSRYRRPMKRLLLLSTTHLIVAAIGFAAGIYVLPILIAPEAPSTAEIRAIAERARFSGEFRRDLEDSDALHWGEGIVSIAHGVIALEGRLAPGPDYKLYLSSEFVETETAFLRLKPSMALVGDVETFENFVVRLPETIDPARYTTVVVWCESFSQFITAARYQ